MTQALEQIYADFSTLNDEMKRLQTEMQEKSKKRIGPMFAAFFAKYPIVTQLSWTQYAPHFNDGEACEFSVHEMEYEIDHDDSASIFSEREVASLKESIAEMEAFEADPEAARQKYERQYEKRFNRSPWGQYGIGRNSRTADEERLRWRPTHRSLDTLRASLEAAIEQKEKYPHLADDYQQLRTLISSVDEDVMKAVFGADCRVVATPEGLVSEEYDHD